MGGVFQDAGTLRLTHDGSERCITHTSESVHERRSQRRRRVKPNRRQLGGIADEDKPAIDPRPNKADKVLKQVSRPEFGTSLPLRIYADERHLIHDVERPLGLVRRQ